MSDDLNNSETSNENNKAIQNNSSKNTNNKSK